jgi:hypothetical protein
MSFMDSLKGFGGWFAKAWTKVFTEAPKVTTVADTVLAYAVPALSIVLSMAAPEEAPLILPVITEVQKDLHVASGLIYDFGATPQASSIVSAIENDLSGLLAAGHIKNPDLVAKVQGIVTTIGSLATALTNKQ